MKRTIISALAAVAAFSASAITATKEYVDRRDGETLQAAKAYTDEHGGGGGGLDTNAVERIANRAAETNAVVLAKADEFTPWEYAYNDELSFDYKMEAEQVDEEVRYDLYRRELVGEDWMPWEKVEETYGGRDELVVRFDSEDVTATRKRVLRTGDAPTQSDLAAATNYAKSYTDEKTTGLIGAGGGEIYGELSVAVLSAGNIQDVGTIEVRSIELNGENVEQNYAKKTYVDNAMETATEEALARFAFQQTQIDANAEAGTNYVNSATGAVAKVAGRYATATAQVTRATQDGITVNSVAAANWAGSVVEVQTESGATNAALTVDLTGMETGLMSDVVLEITNATGAACAVGVVGAEVWKFDGDEAAIASNRLAVVTVTVLPSGKRLVAVREVTR